MSLRHWTCAAALLVPGTAQAQPTLDSLWPNADGLRWSYELEYTSIDQPNSTASATLWFEGTVQTLGGTAQVLHATHSLPAKAHPGVASDPLLASLWRARPDLRAAIEARIGRSLEDAIIWWPLLLHGGWFIKNPTNIQMWWTWNHPTWTYLTDDLRVGATFTQQVVHELADNVFLHGTVEAIDATVATPSGTYETAVRIGYVLDYGWYEVIDEDGAFLGRARSETRGYVHFVPGVGPVEMHEDWIPYLEADCTPSVCPHEDLVGVTVTTSKLSLADVVSVEQSTWSTVKSLYRQ